ncbi:hypothetical protein K470DRAFT_221939 [Piedraia hortae CBS 480.64]|uniref:MARVEL domain-containing protein n=1 Tax=Piedraia hortae CBS 480.64 TaxID=1314780 RepID=A0A6A7BT74_9PEZI|nr:hypothetical protein K470DRAFT_221939 [Piedraia hortae CBS 480.64]
MGLFKGGFLRILETLLYTLAFCCSAIILGIYSYFLSVLADRKGKIQTWKKVVEGLSGAATLYLLFAVVLTCALGGMPFFAFIAIILDILFFIAMIVMAVLLRHGAGSCKGQVNTPLGNGQANSNTGGWGGRDGKGGFGTGGNNNLTYSVKLGTACRLNKAAFAVSLIGALLFFLAAVLQIALVRQHKKHKRYGPSPANNYTSGPGKRHGLFGKKKKATHDAELGTAGTAGAVGAGTGAGLAAPAHEMRPSADTAYTGTTMAPNNGATYDKPAGHGLFHHGAEQQAPVNNSVAEPAMGTHGGYYTQPQGTGVNPYGYEAAQPATHTGNPITNAIHRVV